MTYKTPTKTAIDQYLREHMDEFLSVQQIAQGLSSEGHRIGIATVHRHLRRLADDGHVRVQHKNQRHYYQLIQPDCHSHYHLRCQRCDSVLHLNCPELHAASRHVYAAHGFAIDRDVVIVGVCEDCRVRESLCLRAK